LNIFSKFASGESQQLVPKSQNHQEKENMFLCLEASVGDLFVLITTVQAPTVFLACVENSGVETNWLDSGVLVFPTW
jgi:hypothetical protein